jgi:transaldolase
MPSVDALKIKIFMDGADIEAMRSSVANNPLIKGFTTNPTLMRKAGITDYEAFARSALAAAGGRPISFEVFSDDFDTMEREARMIASWGRGIYVKIPITNTKGESANPLIGKLSADGIALNITAILTLDQVRGVADSLHPDTPSVVSVFAGRIADTGVDPVPLMADAVRILSKRLKAELLWASPRELLNILQADDCGCHIITATPDVLTKLSLVGKDLGAYSLETVKMFHNDAKAAGYKLV